MSRIGKKPIAIPKDVQYNQAGDLLTIKGPKGELKLRIHPSIQINSEDYQITLSVDNGLKGSKSMHGLFRALIANMITGVSQGFERVLEIVGVGYRAELSGKTITFHLGYSHPIRFDLPEGINASIDRSKITLSGIDKELLGRTAAKIRGLRKPEPFKGKGIRYLNETIRRKAGKTGAKQ